MKKVPHTGQYQHRQTLWLGPIQHRLQRHRLIGIPMQQKGLVVQLWRQWRDLKSTRRKTHQHQ